MSMIDSLTCKLEQLLADQDRTQGSVDTVLKEVLAQLKDRTILILQWNEEDVQTVARQKLAMIHGCEEEDIIENPLTREQAIDVIDLMDKYYDCNYGITWDSIDCHLDDIELPSLESCRRKPE